MAARENFSDLQRDAEIGYDPNAIYACPQKDNAEVWQSPSEKGIARIDVALGLLVIVGGIGGLMSHAAPVNAADSHCDVTHPQDWRGIWSSWQSPIVNLPDLLVQPGMAPLGLYTDFNPHLASGVILSPGGPDSAFQVIEKPIDLRCLRNPDQIVQAITKAAPSIEIDENGGELFFGFLTKSNLRSLVTNFPAGTPEDFRVLTVIDPQSGVVDRDLVLELENGVRVHPVAIVEDVTQGNTYEVSWAKAPKSIDREGNETLSVWDKKTKTFVERVINYNVPVAEAP